VNSAQLVSPGRQLDLSPDISRRAARPFLKWAGGKHKLLSQLIPRCPASFTCYYEPFLGGGALFFGLSPGQAVLSDANDELITAFQAVRDRPDDVINYLRRHRNQKAHFLQVRRRDPHTMDGAARAARLVFLNRTCYNGLYRVNRGGQFNTPFGRYKRPNICNAATIHEASVALQGTTISTLDFRTA